MDKIAQIKLAETHGVLAALADTGLLKVASEEDFDFMTEKVAEALGDDYDMDQVISKTAGCEYLMDKIASEEFSIDEVAEVMDKEACTFADLGEFLMLKEAAAGRRGNVAPVVKPRTIGTTPKSVSQGNQGTATVDAVKEHPNALRAGEWDGSENKAPASPGKKYAPVAQEATPLRDRIIGAIKSRAQGAGINKNELRTILDAHSVGNTAVRNNSAMRMAKNVAGTAGVYSIPAAAALYGGKKLYDRFKSDK